MHTRDTSLFDDTKEDIAKAGKILREGGLIAFPTETVYGLGADARNEAAVQAVYAAKGRPSDNPMIVHIAAAEQLAELAAQVTEQMQRLADALWPGPLTMIVQRRWIDGKPVVPDVTTGGLDTVGVRLPADPMARALIAAAGCPVAAPSANLSGRPSPTQAEHVIHDLGGRIDGILQGGHCPVGIESSVIDMTTDVPMILRPGKYTAEDFAQVLGRTVILDPALNSRPEDDTHLIPRAPGMKYRHYAPQAEMIVFEGAQERVEAAIQEEARRAREDGKKVAVLSYGIGQEEVAARELFARLRKADEEGCDLILATALPEEGLGFSVMNRMLKSAGFHTIKV